MKSAQFEKLGPPTTVLTLTDIPIPEPGPGEVVIKVNTCNINPADIMFVQGMYGIRPELPSAAGFEGAGSIHTCGEGVQMPEGTRVVFITIGAWQQYVRVPAKTIIPIPDELNDEVACQAFVNPFTAYGMLESSGLVAGDWLLLTAGASACSKFVVQMCRERQINTICTVRDDKQINTLKDTGATEVVNTEKDDLKAEVMRITAKNGVKHVFEAVGGSLGTTALECITRGGTFTAYGMLSLQNMALNTSLLIFKNITVRGFWLTSWLGSLSKEEMILVSKKVMTALATQQVKADVEASYPLEEIIKAIEHMESPGRNGKIILRPH
ncbi:zinc-dependent alcohol dehydrogenase family protein [Fulvivirgaceae bacterium BMA12]|uniref:Zinc-dependent alcohol dehydrogenase family protein n=1 Tax=Agaribacillus aureus TaxID=3051825 RepID=A0ABT8LA12_9BACT|nr:zinc-dependent alcohol dehydrogenase family protein [Fulvivirgaceae bacterium BMA12]